MDGTLEEERKINKPETDMDRQGVFASAPWSVPGGSKRNWPFKIKIFSYGRTNHIARGGRHVQPHVLLQHVHIMP